jgi:hypothetical protein
MGSEALMASFQFGSTKKMGAFIISHLMIESEPFESFEESLASAEKNWRETVGGFWRDIEEAEKHVEHLREQGYIPW